MSNIKEIREKISSIRNIQKIAKAMEMLSISKTKKARERMLTSQPYVETIRKVIDHVSASQLKYKHSYCIQRNIKCVGYWVISTDRGLTGGLNINLFRVLLSDIKKWHIMQVKTKLAIVGAKGIAFFKNYTQSKVVSCVSGIGDNPKMSQLIGLVRVLLQLYITQEVDRLYLIYNKCVNTLSQIPIILQILPILSSHNNQLQVQMWDYLYEPEPQVLLDILLQRYIESQIYQGVVENLASEQSARMVAMKTAADNGETLINDLKLLYNKVRQTKITKELSEIISGASVV